MKNLAAALVEAQKNMPEVPKEAFANYGKYATLDSLINKTRKVLNEHGLAITQFPAETAVGGPGLRTVLIHAESGEHIDATVPLLLNGKNDMQALGGAITYARRYGWASVLGIASEHDDDGDEVSGAAVPAAGAGAGGANPSPAPPASRAAAGTGGSVGGRAGHAAQAGDAAASPADANGWTFPFGKHKGRSIPEIEADAPEYLDWVLEKTDKEDIKDRIRSFRAEGELASVGATEVDDVPFGDDVDDDIPFDRTIDGLGN